MHHTQRLISTILLKPHAPRATSSQEEYAYETEAHLYLHDRLTKFDWDTLYDLHYTLITIGKVFCTKRAPNCSQCPLKDQCEYAKNGGPRLATDTVPFPQPAPGPGPAPPVPAPPQPLPDVEDLAGTPGGGVPRPHTAADVGSGSTLPPQAEPPAQQGRNPTGPTVSGLVQQQHAAQSRHADAASASVPMRTQLDGAEEVARILELKTDEWHVVGGADREATYAHW